GILLLLQPATSVVVILLGTGLTMYFVSGAPLKYLLYMVVAGAVVIGLLILVTPYRMARITAFLNPGASADQHNYQLNQAQIAIGSGGFFGRGYGQSATKASYL